MSFTQTTFFGASIRSFTASIGWNDTPSTLSVQLVEDPKNGDSFEEPGMGTAAFFNYDGWVFNGIVSNWQRTGGSDGSPLYSIEIADPRELLDGVELILDGYTGGTSDVPNLINVYGYLENVFGFGGAERNDSGIPWINVRSVTQTLTLSETIYGGPVRFRDDVYAVDLTGLQLVPDTYRVGGTDISLLGFIQEMCSAASADFFVTMKLINGIKTIIVNTISRRTQPQFGKINQFINGTEGATSKGVGFELRNEITSKFVSGGAIQELFTQFYQAESGNRYDDDTIWPFWGFDSKGNVLVGEGFDDDHTVELDASAVDVAGIGDTYKTDVAELRAAIDSQVGWEAFLEYNNDIQTRESDGKPNPHYRKAERIGLIGNTLKNVALFFQNKNLAQVQAIVPIDLMNLPNDDPTKDDAEENTARLYRYVKEFAEAYYGRQFMVRVPFVSAKRDENDQVVTSREPTEGGWINENDYPYAIQNKLMPKNFDRVSLQDGRLQCYVRFSDVDNYDFSKLDAEDIIIQESTAFIKCTVQENLVFLDKETAFSPRAVVELPGPVLDQDTKFDGVFRDILEIELKKRNSPNVQRDLNRILKRFGADALSGAKGGSAILPEMAAVPLRSNIDSYGPWVAIGANGKTDFEKDDSLVPWNYGGFTAMHSVGSAKVQIALANQQAAENGNVDFPGIPARELGDALIEGGPYVTSVDVSIGEDGVKTNYKMNTWTPELGTFAKQRQEQIQKIAQKSQNDRRNARSDARRRAAAKNLSRWKRKQLDIINRQKSNSSHQVMGGVYTHAEDETLTNIVSMPTYNVIGKTDEKDVDAYSRGAVSMDGLFRPFTAVETSGGTGYHAQSNAYNSGLLPTYLIPESGALRPTARDLNPFVGGGSGDVSYLFNNSPMALRGPLVISGWGWDEDDNVVPDIEETGIENFYNRADLWKTGPVDIRWSESRGVWVAGGGSKIRAGVITETNDDDLLGKFDLLATSATGVDDTGEPAESDLDYSNWLSIPVATGQKVLVTKLGSQWHLVNAEYTGVDVVTEVICTDLGIKTTKRTIYLGSAFGQEKICEAEDE